MPLRPGTLLAAASLGAVACGPGARAPEAIAARTGLAADAGVEQVATHCLSCHSARLILQNRGAEGDWLATIRWMQERQGLWALEPGDERAIVAYLARNYPRAEAVSRRAPLPPELMPPLPDRGSAAEGS